MVYDGPSYAEYASRVSESLRPGARVVLVETPPVDDRCWSRVAEELRELLRQAGLKHASFVCFEATCALVQFVCLNEPKQVRTLVMVDPSSRPHPRLIDKIVDRLERSLPMGLPLRSRRDVFDSKAYLQRLRCPTLIVSTAKANAYLEREAGIMAGQSPTAWAMKLKTSDEPAEISSLVTQFQSIPAKCPQKNELQGRTVAAVAR